MTNTARAHSFHAWFLSNSADRVSAALSDMEACVKIFDRYTNEVWGIASERAARLGEDVMSWLAEFFGIDLIDSLALFKTLMVRYACEKLAVELIQPVAA